MTGSSAQVFICSFCAMSLQCRACIDAGVVDVFAELGSNFCRLQSQLIDTIPVSKDGNDDDLSLKREAQLAITLLREEVMHAEGNRRSALRKTPFTQSGSSHSSDGLNLTNAFTSMTTMKQMMRELLQESVCNPTFFIRDLNWQ